MTARGNGAQTRRRVRMVSAMLRRTCACGVSEHPFGTGALVQISLSPRTASAGHDEWMPWVGVRAGQDHLQQYVRRSAIDALTELIWNGLDAESDVVDVELELSSVVDSGRELMHVTRVNCLRQGSWHVAGGGSRGVWLTRRFVEAHVEWPNCERQASVARRRRAGPLFRLRPRAPSPLEECLRVTWCVHPRQDPEVIERESMASR